MEPFDNKSGCDTHVVIRWSTISLLWFNVFFTLIRAQVASHDSVTLQLQRERDLAQDDVCMCLHTCSDQVFERKVGCVANKETISA